MKRIIVILLFLVVAYQTNAQKNIDLHLRINGVKSASHFNDELIRATLIVSLPFAEEDNRMNNSMDDLIMELSDSLDQGLIDQSYFEAQRDTLELYKFVEDVLNISDLKDSWKEQINFKVKSQGKEVVYFQLAACNVDDFDQKQLSSQNRLYLNFLLEKTNNFSPGNFEIQILYKDAISNTCRLTVKQESVPTSTSNSEEYLIDQAHHYFVCNDADNLMKLAKAILKINDQSISGHTFLADAHYMKNNNQEALKLYRIALELFYNQYPDEYESPEYLISSINLLEAKD